MIDGHIGFQGFHYQDNYSPRDRKGYRSCLSHYPLIQILAKIWKRTDMTSQLISLSDHPSSPVRAKVKCCKLCNLFGCQATDLLSHQDPIFKHYRLLPTANRYPHEAVRLTLLQRSSQHFLQPQPTRREHISSVYWRVYISIKTS